MRLLLFLILALQSAASFAHPTAQGQVDLRLTGDPLEALELRLRVANEQVFEVSAFEKKQSTAGDYPTLVKEHAPYVLAHVAVKAGTLPLSGEIVQVEPGSDSSVNGFAVYRLRYPLPKEAVGTKLEIAQNLMNEIEFAPGNRWEAPFISRLLVRDQIIAENLLWTAQSPVTWDLATAMKPPAAAHAGNRFATFMAHGAHHILTGYDHLLFAAALVLALTRFRQILWVVTAFTIAHSITLAVVVLRWFDPPSAIIEPLIAGSIVVAAVMNLFPERRSSDWIRVGIAFSFGLAHGLGFAGGLVEAMQELPNQSIFGAILAFSLGVELAHQVVVLPVFLGLAFVRRRDDQAPRAFAPILARAGSLAVCAGGVYFLWGTLAG